MVGKRIRRYFRLGHYRNLKRKYTAYCLFMIFLCILLIFSVCRVMAGNSSLVVYLITICPQGMPYFLLLNRMLNIDAILKVGEAVGICSFLIAWVYAALDKEELGIRYGELLRELYPGYHWFVLMHLTAFVVCIWMAKIRRLEPAALALVIVLSDNLLQWKTLENLILFSEKRQKIAIDRWYRLLDENQREEECQQRKNEKLLVIISNIADAVVFDVDSRYETMGQLLAKAIAQYIDGLQFATTDEWVCSFREISKIWDRVLEGRGQNSRAGNQDKKELLAIEILRENAWKGHRSVLPIGYLLWRYGGHMEQVVVNAASLTALSEELTILIQHHFDHRSYPHSVPFYMESAFTLLAWMHFMCRTIGLDRELFKLSPAEHPTEEDWMALQGFAHVVFTEEICGQYLEQAMGQIFGDYLAGRMEGS